MKHLMVVAAFGLALAGTARADRDAASQASELSTLPIAVSVDLSAGVLMSAASFVVVAASATADGTVWVLERASDGARISVTVGAAAAGGLSLAAGSTVEAVASSAGWVLSTAGKAIAFVPNEIGRALLHNEKVSL